MLIGAALLICAVGTYAAIYRPLLNDLAASEMRLAADRVTTDVDTIFSRVERLAHTERDWGTHGLINLDHLDAFNALLYPLIERRNDISSFAVAEDTGREILITALPEHGWSDRLTDPDVADGVGRFLTYDAQGGLTKDEQRAANYDARRRPWFQTAMGMASDDEIHWTAPYTYVSTAEPGVSALLRWVAPDGHRYAMTNDVRLLDLTRFTQQIDVGRSGLAALLTDDGKVLGLPRDPRFGAADLIKESVLKPVESLDVPPLMASFAAWEKRGRPVAEVVRVSVAGTTWFASFHPIHPAGQTFWIATLAPSSDFGPLSGDALAIGIALILGSLIVASAAALALGTRFSHPIERLMAESARIGRMDLAHPITVTSPVGEINALAQSLEEMRLSFIRSRQELEDKAELERQLAQARKMEAVGQLAGGIAHDFNNILGAILGFATFLREDLREGTPQHNFARRILDAGMRAKELVQQILTFSRVSTVERTPLDLAQLVREADALLRASLSPSTRLDLVLPGEPVVAEVNAGQISQILLNLCINANDSLGGEAGRIAIALAVLSPGAADYGFFAATSSAPIGRFGGAQFGTLDPAKSYARISVSDTGAGMDDVTLKRIFEPFYSTKERGKGTGLGLAVVHGIVQSYDGACIVTSQPKGGSLFVIYLPLSASAVLPTARGTGVVPRGHERLLVIDDETMITDMLTIGLGRLGYDVTAMNDPEAALRAFQQSPDRWDVVVSDLAMPRMDGITLFGKLRAVRPAVRFILCSGFGDDATEDKAATLGISAFLVKPIAPEKLAECIRPMFDHPTATIAVLPPLPVAARLP